MKTHKILILFIFCLSSVLCYSQLTIDASSRVIFGVDKTYNNGISIYDEASSAKNTPFRLYKKDDDNIYLTRGNELKGMRINPNGRFYLGENGFMASSWTGLLNLYVNSSVGMVIMQRTNSTALHIDANGANSTLIDVNGPLAQDQPFLLKGNGSMTLGVNSSFIIKKSASQNTRFEVNATGVFVNGIAIQTSDAQLKKNIQTIESPLAKIKQLRGVTYERLSMEEEARFFNIPIEEVDKMKELAAEKEKLQEEMEKGISPEIQTKMAAEKNRKEMGVVAQEVEKVIPEVVRTHESGTLGVAYSQLVGLLIEGMKEQQVLIEQLQKEVSALKSKTKLSDELITKN